MKKVSTQTSTAWDREYIDSQMISEQKKPQNDVLAFFRFLRRKQKLDLVGCQGLDLGAGTGKHAQVMLEYGMGVKALEFSAVAVRKLKDNLLSPNSQVELWDLQKFPWPVADGSCDVVIDVMVSHAIPYSLRQQYAKEVGRVLRPGGWYFLKSLSRDNDKHAQTLAQTHAGPEIGSYIMPGLDLIEFPVSRAELQNWYSDLRCERLEEKVSYTPVLGRKFKRHFWLGYWQKPL